VFVDMARRFRANIAKENVFAVRRPDAIFVTTEGFADCQNSSPKISTPSSFGSFFVKAVIEFAFIKLLWRAVSTSVDLHF
jgi:hypothetical protein